MKSRSMFWILALLLVVISPVIAQDAPVDDPFLRLLSYIPDTPENREIVAYGNPALWYESWDVLRPTETSQVRDPNASEIQTSRAFINVVPDQTIPPEALGLQYFLLDEMKSFYGFDLLSADQWLQAGNPPDWTTVVDLTAGLGPAVESALTASGYATAEAENATLYSLHEDYQVNLGGDGPRVGMLGSLNRIAVAGDVLVIAKATAIANSALETAAGQTDSLEDARDYQALVAALRDPALDAWPDLVGAMVLPGATFSVMDPAVIGRGGQEAMEALMEHIDAAPPLPMATTAAFATKHGDGESALVMALVFPPGTDAQAAADSLVERLQTLPSIVQNRPLTDLFADLSVTIEQAVGVEVAGLPVALIVLTQPDPDLGVAPLEPRPFSWTRLIFARDTLFLIASGDESDGQ